MVKELEHSTAQVSARLIRQLKRKDHRIAKLQRNCDIVTAIIQAASLKRREILSLLKMYRQAAK